MMTAPPRTHTPVGWAGRCPFAEISALFSGSPLFALDGRGGREGGRGFFLACHVPKLSLHAHVRTSPRSKAAGGGAGPAKNGPLPERLCWPSLSSSSPPPCQDYSRARCCPGSAHAPGPGPRTSCGHARARPQQPGLPFALARGGAALAAGAGQASAQAAPRQQLFPSGASEGPPERQTPGPVRPSFAPAQCRPHGRPPAGGRFPGLGQVRVPSRPASAAPLPHPATPSPPEAASIGSPLHCAGWAGLGCPRPRRRLPYWFGLLA